MLVLWFRKEGKQGLKSIYGNIYMFADRLSVDEREKCQVKSKILLFIDSFECSCDNGVAKGSHCGVFTELLQIQID